LEMMRPNIDALIGGIIRTKTLDLLLDNAHVVPAETKSPDDESNKT
jgi:hypothetical protein